MEKNINITRKNPKMYLSNRYADNRYLLAEDLNGDTDILISNYSKMVKTIFGTGEVLIYNENNISYNKVSKIHTLNGLELFIDGIPITIQDVDLIQNGDVYILIGTKLIDLSNPPMKYGKVLLQGISTLGVDMKTQQLDNDVILKDPVFGDSITSNRSQLQYQLYIGNALTNIEKGDKSGASKTGANVDYPDFYCIKLCKKTDDELNFNVGNFELVNGLGMRNEFLPKLKDLDNDLFSGFTNNITTNKPVNSNDGVCYVDKSVKGEDTYIRQVWLDFEHTVEWWRTIIIKKSGTVTKSPWENSRLYQDTLIKLTDENYFNTEIGLNTI